MFAGGYLSLSDYPWFSNKTTEYLPPGPGSIPIKVEFEAPYEDRDRRKRRTQDEAAPTHVHSVSNTLFACDYRHRADFQQRRRAQNRASQRAFRDRKEKYTKELGERLQELETKHQNLMQSYETLQAKYESAREKLERFLVEHDDNDSTNMAAQSALLDPSEQDLSALLFDDSVFLFQETAFEQKLGNNSGA